MRLIALRSAGTPRASRWKMGNSPQMLFRNYRELADERDAAAWFNLFPSVAGNVVPMRRFASGKRR